ncbi:MAG TPA: hypothetical protein VNX02_11170 [Steroidobacteraceae bacterium]|jgi:hypothetical protein|nr:hypothetical protein [Steroidobacteraceae bacterium]
MRILRKLNSMTTLAPSAGAETAASSIRTRSGEKRVGPGFRHNGLSSSILLALVAAIVFIAPSGEGQAQSGTQSGTRTFQMTLWLSDNTPTAPTRAQIDIIATYLDALPTTTGRCPTTTGPAIVIDYPYTQWVTVNGSVTTATVPNTWNTKPTPCNQNGVPIDWAQVVAVEVDEPYGPPYSSVDSDFYDDTGQCITPPSSAIETIDAQLSATAAALKSVNPKIRFWVNFDATEGAWFAACGNPQFFNRSYIDVISFDCYSTPFFSTSSTSSYSCSSAVFSTSSASSATYNLSESYNVLAANRATPHQQLALIPGVFYGSTGYNQLPYLQGYFQYANQVNQTCNLPLGPQGVSGIYDGCPVWVVMGFLTGDITANGVTSTYGVLDGSAGSQPILAAWQAEVALRPVTPNAKVIPAVLKLLLL